LRVSGDRFFAFYSREITSRRRYWPLGTEFIKGLIGLF